MKALFSFLKNQIVIRPLKSFYAELHGDYQLRDLGVKLICLSEIVGSVNRAMEFDRHFHCFNPHVNERLAPLAKMMCAGKAIPPIKVYLLQRPGKPVEYYVIDGHHRIMIAKQQGCQTINAEIIEVVLDPVKPVLS